MTTKEQERKALGQIKKIIEGLGPDSYVGIAFEGCAVIAEENINNDFACSMKQRAEAAEKDAKRIGDLYTKAIARADELEKKCDEAYEEITAEAKRRANVADSLRITLEKETARADDAAQIAAALEAENAKMRQEIIELKAKLYDMITAAG